MKARKNRPVLWELGKSGGNAPPPARSSAVRVVRPPKPAHRPGQPEPEPETEVAAPESEASPAVTEATEDRAAQSEPTVVQPERISAPMEPPPRTKPRVAPATPTAPSPYDPLHAASRGSDDGENWMNRVFVLRITTPGAVVAVGLLLVMLYTAFQGGRMVGGGSSPETTTQNDNSLTDDGAELAADTQPMVGDVTPPATPQRNIEPATPRPAPAAASNTTSTTPPAAPRFQARAGYHYVVVQHFQRSRPDDARAAAEFLMQSGVPVALITGPDIRLIVAEHFLLEQPDQRAADAESRRAEQMRERIRTLGKEYAKIGDYNFKDTYIRKLVRKSD